MTDIKSVIVIKVVFAASVTPHILMTTKEWN